MGLYDVVVGNGKKGESTRERREPGRKARAREKGENLGERREHGRKGRTLRRGIAVGNATTDILSQDKQAVTSPLWSNLYMRHCR